MIPLLNCPRAHLYAVALIIRHRQGQRELDLVRENAILINTARGALIDEAALLATLDAGHLHGAGLDVFATEPVGPANPLVHHPRVVATPHIGYSTADAERELLRRGLKNALRAIKPLMVEQ